MREIERRTFLAALTVGVLGTPLAAEAGSSSRTMTQSVLLGKKPSLEDQCSCLVTARRE